MPGYTRFVITGLDFVVWGTAGPKTWLEFCRSARVMRCTDWADTSGTGAAITRLASPKATSIAGELMFVSLIVAVSVFVRIDE